MLLTDKAMYNLMPNNYGKCKRRIGVEGLYAITASNISDEFVLHVPDEYDYRFKSAKKNKICEYLTKMYTAYVDLHGPVSGGTSSLTCQFVNQADLKEKALTKAMARLQSRDEIVARATRVGEDAVKPGEGVTRLLEHSSVQLEDFKLLKVLGRGSFGKVMQVRKISDGKVYAMKILRKRTIIQRNQVEHTKAERKILQTLQHPFLMTLRYAFQSKEKLYFVLDYFQGGELFFHLKNNRRFSEDVARVYVAEIGLALGHLHGLGIIYRDLKPENILLDDNGHVCLTDFGLSKDVDPNDKAHTFCGTPEYLAPEIVTGAGHDKAVDWWSLGILLYELTVGIPPFYSPNVNEMYNKIQRGSMRFPAFLSEPCKALIVGLLDRDPKKRLGSKDDVNDIKRQPFFATIDWNRLYRKEVEVAYKPQVKDITDTRNFDDNFTAEAVVDSVLSASEAAQPDPGNTFAGFSYRADGLGTS